MPPQPVQVDGRDAILESWRPVLAGASAWGRWRAVLTSVNRQPAVANYLRPTREIVFPDGTRAVPGPWFERGPLDVLRIEHGLVVEVTTFGSYDHAALGLPERLP
jgi:RNA polymerase sigma-70 factor (ECF subfamily)